MTDENPKQTKKPRQKRPTVEPCIYPNLDENGNPDGTFDVKVSRRMWMSDSNPHGQMFRRKRRVHDIVAAQRLKKKFLDELAMEALKHEGKDMKWKVALETYFEYLERRHKENTLSYSTMETTISTLKAHTTTWGEKWLSDFKTSFIEDFIFSADLKSKLEVATRVSLLKYIRGVFNRQVAMGRITHNPVMGITLRMNKAPDYPKWMSKDEMARLIKYAESVNPDWALIYKFAYWTGARSGELFSLKWEDYITKEGMKCFEIRRTYCWKSETEKEPKGRQKRIVPVNKFLVPLLAELRLKNPSAIYILPRLADWRNGKAAQIIRQYQAAIGIEQSKFHAIRASFITNLLLSRPPVPIIKIQSMVGHQDLKTLLYYQGKLGKELEGATDSLSLDENPVLNIDDFKGKKKTP